jgi:galactokinase
LTTTPGEWRFPSGTEPFVTGVRAVIRDAEPLDGTIVSTIPPGAGLSSSTALTTALAFALGRGNKPTPELVLEAETIGTGVPGGLMDQTAILEGKRHHALLLDCASRVFDYVEIPPQTSFVVIDTGTRRSLADGRYAQRRNEVESGEPKRVRHAESEQQRVYAAGEALDDPDTLGKLISASHRSLRDDFEVSSNELDEAVARAEAQRGCTGARLVGAGFAGCILAVAHTDAAQDIADAFDDAWVVHAIDGASEV